VPPYPLSAFRRIQISFELRFDPAYLLWDTTGAMWQSVKRLFKTFKHQQVSPNETSFIGDGRFVLTVSLDRAVITDHTPAGAASAAVEVMSTFSDIVVSQLRIPVLNRIGTRVIHSIKCKSAEEARQKAAEAVPLSVAGNEFFGISESTFSPHLKIDASDGELGYTVQLYISEKKFEFEPPPEFATALNLDRRSETIDELLLDMDFFTKKPMPIESFDARVWLNGWNKAIARDTDKFLDRLSKSSHG
jgi:hypothetical protein